jgi:hypothetical protein
LGDEAVAIAPDQAVAPFDRLGGGAGESFDREHRPAGGQLQAGALGP